MSSSVKSSLLTSSVQTSIALEDLQDAGELVLGSTESTSYTDGRSQKKKKISKRRVPAGVAANTRSSLSEDTRRSAAFSHTVSEGVLGSRKHSSASPKRSRSKKFLRASGANGASLKDCNALEALGKALPDSFGSIISHHGLPPIPVESSRLGVAQEPLASLSSAESSPVVGKALSTDSVWQIPTDSVPKIITDISAVGDNVETKEAKGSGNIPSVTEPKHVEMEAERERQQDKKPLLENRSSLSSCQSLGLGKDLGEEDVKETVRRIGEDNLHLPALPEVIGTGSNVRFASYASSDNPGGASMSASMSFNKATTADSKSTRTRKTRKSYHPATVLAPKQYRRLYGIVHRRIWKAMGATSIIVAVFAPDLFVIWQVEGNLILDLLLSAVLLLFLIELVGMTLADVNYFLSSLWFADIVGIASMAFDVSYMLGDDATEPRRVETSEAGQNLSMVRVARVSKFIARAGRITRLLRALKMYLRQTKDEEVEEGETCKVITKQLFEKLSTRLSIWSLFLAVAIPFVQSFLYPSTDYSLAAFIVMLDADAAAYYLATNSTEQVAKASKLTRSLTRFVEFYKDKDFGPCEACFRPNATQAFICGSGVIPSVNWSSPFATPGRLSSQWVIGGDHFLAKYDVSTPEQLEALSRILIVLVVIFLLVIFGMRLGTEVKALTIKPMQRMLNTIRANCCVIFDYTSTLQKSLKRNQTKKNLEDHAEDDDLLEKNFASAGVNETDLLEKVVASLTCIVKRSMEQRRTVIEMQSLDEEEQMKMCFMEGTYFAILKSEDKADSECSMPIEERLSHKTSMMAKKERLRKRDSSAELGLYFNSFCMPEERRCPVAVKMITSATSTKWFAEKVVKGQLLTFISSLQAEYDKNIFHNFCHAMDVLNSVCIYVTNFLGPQFIKDWSRFGLLVAAIGHDIRHPGLNNMYLVQVSHELALIYNDMSPLESHACAKLFQIVKDPAANIFAQAVGEDYKILRKDVIEAVLHTDMTRHLALMVEMAMLYQMHEEDFNKEDPWSSREVYDILHTSNALILKAFLHAADNSHPTRPWDLCKLLSHKLMEEYFAQGDLAKDAGIPVQILSDRDRVTVPRMQVSFIEHVTMPMIETMVRIFPVDAMADNLSDNFEKWVDIWIDESDVSQDLEERLYKRADVMRALCKAICGSDVFCSQTSAAYTQRSSA